MAVVSATADDCIVLNFVYRIRRVSGTIPPKTSLIPGFRYLVFGIWFSISGFWYLQQSVNKFVSLVLKSLADIIFVKNVQSHFDQLFAYTAPYS